MSNFEEILREYVARETARRARLELAAKLVCASDRQVKRIIAEQGNPFQGIESTAVAQAMLRESPAGELRPVQKWSAIRALYNASVQVDWSKVYGRWLADFSRVIEPGLVPAITEGLPKLAPLDVSPEPEAATGIAESFQTAASRLLELVKVAARRMPNGQNKTEVSGSAESKTSPFSEGEWLMPPVALAVLANRLGNVGPAKAKTYLRQYNLRTEGNRQSWTCRLDTMPPDLRRRVEGKR